MACRSRRSPTRTGSPPAAISPCPPSPSMKPPSRPTATSSCAGARTPASASRPTPRRRCRRSSRGRCARPAPGARRLPTSSRPPCCSRAASGACCWPMRSAGSRPAGDSARCSAPIPTSNFTPSPIHRRRSPHWRKRTGLRAAANCPCWSSSVRAAPARAIARRSKRRLPRCLRPTAYCSAASRLTKARSQRPMPTRRCARSRR